MDQRVVYTMREDKVGTARSAGGDLDSLTLPRGCSSLVARCILRWVSTLYELK